ncbi:MAG: Flavodoxin reductases (ferredoxin-NADPH reductases) family 1 [Nitrospira sp.]|jgi:predicted pyridoxine 5'-phosphate oxidase superfamily flavin-nucleotide-binding protein|nr:MAG: Flavodoxin reductases (ferredoxin-NADPH reductases) family 1 [Nitrospira sp.]
MNSPVSDIAFTASVKDVQRHMGSRKQYERMEKSGGWENTITRDLSDFIGERDSLYLATASATGRPYIQHRGGPKGFLKVLDDRTLAFADFAGNRQYISVGNLAENNQACLFLMDYASQTRIKIWGTAEAVDNDPRLMKHLTDPGYKGKPERAIRFHVEAWDGNCRQHIRPRFTKEEADALVQPLRDRLAELEAENNALKRQAAARAR